MLGHPFKKTSIAFFHKLVRKLMYSATSYFDNYLSCVHFIGVFFLYNYLFIITKIGVKSIGHEVYLKN